MSDLAYFEQIRAQVCTQYPDVEAGPMMSSPGIKLQGKVVAFYYNDCMVFKLGKQYPIEEHGISDYSHLSPFKNKGPMLAWFEVGKVYADRWLELSELAIELNRK